MKFWKRNAVVTAIILFVGAAVYLNWTYGEEQQAWQKQGNDETLSQATQGEEKILGQPVLVGGTTEKEVTSGKGEANTDKTASSAPTASPGNTAVPSGSASPTDQSAQQTGSDYFASARLSRQQARDSAMSLLKEAPEESTETAQSIQTLASCMMAESRIESLVTAKGYADCVALISENSASIVVAAEEGKLNAEDVARIMDIVKAETAFSQSQIKIVPAAAGEA
jgi:stage III sporulation protein AH